MPRSIFFEGVEQVGLLQFFQHGVVGPVPRLQDGIDGDEDRQIVLPQLVENVGKTARTKSFTDHETVLLERRQLGGVQPVIGVPSCRIIDRFAGVVGLDVGVEAIPELRRGRIKGEPGQIVGVVIVKRRELLRRDVANFAKLVREGSGVAKDFGAVRHQTRPSAGQVADQAVESSRAIRLQAEPEQSFRQAGVTAQAFPDRLPGQQVFAALDFVGRKGNRTVRLQLLSRPAQFQHAVRRLDPERRLFLTQERQWAGQDQEDDCSALHCESVLNWLSSGPPDMDAEIWHFPGQDTVRHRPAFPRLRSRVAVRSAPVSAGPTVSPTRPPVSGGGAPSDSTGLMSRFKWPAAACPSEPATRP